MKRILLVFITLFSLALFFTACGNNDQAGKLAENEIYSCPMHPQVLRDKTGQCPICNMDLQKRKMTPAEIEKMHKTGDHH